MLIRLYQIENVLDNKMNKQNEYIKLLFTLKSWFHPLVAKRCFPFIYHHDDLSTVIILPLPYSTVCSFALHCDSLQR